MPTLVLLRHGESTWNKENRFTGWTDVDLSETGLQEAHEAGRLLLAESFRFDIAHTSVLKRAIRTLWFSLDELDQMWCPVRNSWRLNERHYGALQGLNLPRSPPCHAMERLINVMMRHGGDPKFHRLHAEPRCKPHLISLAGKQKVIDAP